MGKPAERAGEPGMVGRDSGTGADTNIETGAGAAGVAGTDAGAGASTTIVGGQPAGHHRRALVKVPVGIEKVLYAAAVDRTFRRALLADRQAAIRERGFGLRDSERAMLRLATPAQLESAIDGLDVSPVSIERRQFMRAVAVAVTTIAAGEVLEGCDGTSQPAGIRPEDGGRDAAGDAARDTLAVDTSPPTRGISPDAVVVPEGMAPTGIRPDAVSDAIPLPDLGLDTPATQGIRPDSGGSFGMRPDVELECDSGPMAGGGVRPDGSP